MHGKGCADALCAAYQPIVVDLNVLGLLPDIDVVPIACALAWVALEARPRDNAAATRPRNLAATQHKLAHVTAANGGRAGVAHVEVLDGQVPDVVDGDQVRLPEIHPRKLDPVVVHGGGVAGGREKEELCRVPRDLRRRARHD